MANSDPLSSNSYNATDDASISTPPTKVKSTKAPKPPKISVGKLKVYKAPSSKMPSVKVPKVSSGLRGFASSKRIGARAMSVRPARASIRGGGKVIVG